VDPSRFNTPAQAGVATDKTQIRTICSAPLRSLREICCERRYE